MERALLSVSRDDVRERMHSHHQYSQESAGARESFEIS
jgi:hypothetical protein